MSLHLFTIKAIVRPFLPFSVSLLAVALCPAQAQTMYKCVAANAKVIYSDMPCPNQAKASKQFEVPPPETPEQTKARLAQQIERRKRADAELREFQDLHQRALDLQNQRANGTGSYVEAHGRSPSPPASASEPALVPSRKAGAR